MTYNTEEQQIEQLKKLWKEYGWSTIIGIAIALAIVFGWRFYQSYRVNHAEQASLVYERMMMDVLNKQWDDAKDQANVLRQHFAGTSYAKLAALTLAKLAATDGKFAQAVAQLQWVINHASDDAFAQIAKIRLARIYIELNKPEQALQALEKINVVSYTGLVEEVRGDAYVKLGQNDKARAAYKAALANAAETAENRPMVQMKLADLPS